MITLQPTRPHWITDDGDDPTDLCAHSAVDFRVGAAVLVSPESGDWNVSAAALFLLRTLSRPHTKADPVCEHLFPCCGHTMVPTETGDVIVLGCPNGIDVEVIPIGSDVLLRSSDGTEQRVPKEEWRAAVIAFSDAVQRFFEQSLPKEPGDDFNKSGYECFMAEWTRRRREA